MTGSTDHTARRIFKIDVGNIPENEIEDYVRKVLARFKKQPDMSNVNFMQVIPDSHFWSDLNQILESIKHHYYLMEAVPEEHVYHQKPFLTKEYILIGLNNSKKNGYKIKFVEEKNVDVPSIFANVDDMIEFVENRPFELKFDYMDFEETIKNTIKFGLNLTNGLKMNRQDVYKLIDGERDYQDVTWVARRTADGTPDEEKDVAEWINYMEFHIQKAKNAVYYLDRKEALAEVRKVAALAVRAMEIHGAPERIIMPEPKSCCGDGCDCQK